MRLNIQRLFVIAVLSIGAAMGNAQSSDPNDGVYNALVQQAQSLLAAGPDQSLTLSQQIVKLNPARWEGYDLTGLALTSLRRYDEATVQFGQALAHAPATAQPGISAHLKHCVQAETGPAPATEVAPSPQYPQPQPAPQAQPATTQDAAGPSMEVTVQYVLDAINNRAGSRGITSELQSNGIYGFPAKDHTDPTTTVHETFGGEMPVACVLRYTAFYMYQIGGVGYFRRSTYQVNLADIDLRLFVDGSMSSLKGRSAILETDLTSDGKIFSSSPPNKEPALDAWSKAQTDLLESVTTCSPKDKKCKTTQSHPESVQLATTAREFPAALKHLATLCGASASAPPPPPNNIF